jgi:Tfp pilus assembly protein PilF
LEEVGEDGGRSFFTTRKAEFEYLCGDNKRALELIDRAIQKTPKIFEPHKIRCEILLKDGHSAKASDEIKIMHDIVNSRDNREKRSNYREYLEVNSKYLCEIGKFKEAKEIYSDKNIFTDEERGAAVKEIEVYQSFKTQK